MPNDTQATMRHELADFPRRRREALSPAVAKPGDFVDPGLLSVMRAVAERPRLARPYRSTVSVLDERVGRLDFAIMESSSSRRTSDRK